MDTGLSAKCITECTTPQHGHVAEGRDVIFDLPEWDLKRFSYLKHFQQKSKAVAPQLSIDDGATAAKLKAVAKVDSAQPLGVSAPAAQKEPPTLGKKLSEMTPEELDNVTVDMAVAIAGKHGVELDISANRASILIAAMDAEDNSELFQ